MDLSPFYFNNSPLDDVVSPEILDVLLANSSEEKYPAKAKIFEERTRPRGVFVLRKGKVKIYQNAAGDSRRIIAIHGATEVFGYRPILSGERYPVTAETLEPSSIVFIPKKDFLKALQRSTQLSNLFLKYLSREFTIWVNMTSMFSRTTVKERLLLNLLILCERYRDNNSFPVKIGLSKSDLACLIGTSNETLARMLKLLKQEKLIVSRGRKIEIAGAEQFKKIQNAVSLFL
jgi:CRP-like cAMP-binding protein